MDRRVKRAALRSSGWGRTRQEHEPRPFRDFPDLVFVSIGSDRICYSGDQKHIQQPTFREHVLAQHDYDLFRFCFTGLVPVSTLVDILSLSDLHIYLTVPFVLSWSLLHSSGDTLPNSSRAHAKQTGAGSSAVV